MDAEVVLLGSPGYFTDTTAGIKALIERCGMLAMANGGLLKRKVGAGVAVARRAGAIRTFTTLNSLFLHAQMTAYSDQLLDDMLEFAKRLIQIGYNVLRVFETH